VGVIVAQATTAPQSGGAAAERSMGLGMKVTPKDKVAAAVLETQVKFPQ
jgi:hypothetical protein